MNPSKIRALTCALGLSPKYIALFFGRFYATPILITPTSCRIATWLQRSEKKNCITNPSQVYWFKPTRERLLPAVVRPASSLRVLSSRDNLRLTRISPALQAGGYHWPAHSPTPRMGVCVFCSDNLPQKCSKNKHKNMHHVHPKKTVWKT